MCRTDLVVVPARLCACSLLQYRSLLVLKLFFSFFGRRRRLCTRGAQRHCTAQHTHTHTAHTHLHRFSCSFVLRVRMVFFFFFWLYGLLLLLLLYNFFFSLSFKIVLCHYTPHRLFLHPFLQLHCRKNIQIVKTCDGNNPIHWKICTVLHVKRSNMQKNMPVKTADLKCITFFCSCRYFTDRVQCSTLRRVQYSTSRDRKEKVFFSSSCCRRCCFLFFCFFVNIHFTSTIYY